MISFYLRTPKTANIHHMKTIFFYDHIWKVNFPYQISETKTVFSALGFHLCFKTLVITKVKNNEKTVFIILVADSLKTSKPWWRKMLFSTVVEIVIHLLLETFIIIWNIFRLFWVVYFENKLSTKIYNWSHVLSN